MASPLTWKVYNSAGEYMAATRYPEDAARLVGDGDTIKGPNGRIVWREGKEDQPAGESVDHVAMVVQERLIAMYREAHAARQERQAQRPAPTTVEAIPDYSGIGLTPVPTVRLTQTQPTLAEAQRFIGGTVELIRLGQDVQMLCNEDGRMMQLPPNDYATALAGRLIVGPVMLLEGPARWT